MRLMNISLTPENALGRMLYTFNATAYEIDELTIENINKYNIQQVGQLEDIISQGLMMEFGYINYQELHPFPAKNVKNKKSKK